ncbi:MAG: VanW family protein [Acidimicrobiia bacterium]|nr:VanW family protein [Acidimicrobiia bacterium]
MKHRRDTFRAAVIVAALAASLLASIPTAMAVDPPIEPLPPGGTFADDNLIPQEGYIEAIASVGVTKGCVSGEVELFCPDRAVTRAEMAAFIVRALDIPAVTTNTFTDTATSVHVWDIAALHAKGITKGCNPPLADQFCPERTVTRGQMAAFISRAFDLTGDVDRARFTDDDDSLFELEISRAAAAGIAVGCDVDRYCPHEPMLRKDMAVFLANAMGIAPFEVPPPPPVKVLGEFTTYYDACTNCRVTNIHLIGEAVNGTVVQPGQIFSVNDTVGPRTEAKGYVRAGAIIGGAVVCCDHPANVGGGTSQFATTLYNAVFFSGLEDIYHRPHSLYFSRYPMGREATLGYTSPDLQFRNNTRYPVTIEVTYDNTSITVRIMGTSDVASVKANQIGSATSNGGGTVTIQRTVTYLDGRTDFRQWTHTYNAKKSNPDPDPQPPPPPPPPPDPCASVRGLIAAVC